MIEAKLGEINVGAPPKATQPKEARADRKRKPGKDKTRA